MTSEKKLITGKEVAKPNRPSPKSKQVIVFYLFYPKPFLLPSPSICSPPKEVTDEELPISLDKSDPESNSAHTSPPRNVIAANFTMLRNRKGVTLKEVVSITNISLYRLKKLEQCKLRISLSVLIVLSEYFEVSIDDLIETDLSKKYSANQQ